MHLPKFILDHMTEIMEEWVSFARTLETSQQGMTLTQLRDHAEAILRSIALDIDSAQTRQEQYDKSRGNAEDDAGSPTAASIHGTQRHESNFTLLQLSAEFRALRATVLRLWLPRMNALSEDNIREMIRFNEAIDQALAESVVTYSARSDRARELLLAILGHDLRAPLATLTMSGDLLTKSNLPAAEIQKVGARVRRSALTMAGMVNDLIGYTRTELGSGMPIDRKEFDIEDVCRSAMEDAHSTFPDTKFDLSFKGELKGAFDSVRLHQLFTNLLVNAAKYGAQGELVRLQAVGEGDFVHVDVNNRGPVIPKSSWERIFQPLVQLSRIAPDDTKDQRTSLGLGLYVAREIATLHGGSLEVHSTAETGTTFGVRLPRSQTAVQQARE